MCSAGGPMGWPSDPVPKSLPLALGALGARADSRARPLAAVHQIENDNLMDEVFPTSSRGLARRTGMRASPVWSISTCSKTPPSRSVRTGGLVLLGRGVNHWMRPFAVRWSFFMSVPPESEESELGPLKPKPPEESAAEPAQERNAWVGNVYAGI